MVKLTAYIFLALALTLGGCAVRRGPLLYSPPSVVAHTTAEMKTPGFWISRHPAPDAVIMSPEEISRFNQKIRDMKLTKDLAAWPAILVGEELRAALQKTLDDLRSRDLVLIDGKKPSEKYWAAAREAMSLETIPPEIPRQYGLVARYADQRFLPLEEGLYARAHDADFDELQNSALDIGTPVVILHRSLDGKWLRVESSASAGWVKTQNVAVATDEQVRLFQSAPFVVVIVPKADVYRNRAMTDFIGSVQMGVRLPAPYKAALLTGPAARLPDGQGQAGFPLENLDNDSVEIMVPRRQSDGSATLVSGFIPAAEAREGYLPYTPRHVLTQAFKMIHQPYGWGGMYGAQDCSRFLQEVFATVGIELPRDSRDQIQVGTRLIAWEPGAPGEDKTFVLADFAVGGTTLLGMKGHILLYLGTVDDRTYAIHSVWAYRQRGRGEDKVFVLNRVVVSDLSLGQGSRRGSLLERLNAARFIK